MKKILIVIGTRPEAIKMVPLIKKLQWVSNYEVKLCVTAQHREMLDSVLDLFSINPDYDFDLMKSSQSLNDITVRVLKRMEKILIQENPDIVLVHGDTTTTMASALASYYQKIPVGHVEAGLRSGNNYSPYPEEMNRRITSNISLLHFAPTEGNKQNLIQTGVAESQIFVTGNTVIDALNMTIQDDYKYPLALLNKYDYENRRFMLMTVHRRENWGNPMQNIFRAVRRLLNNNPDVELIFPVHLNPTVKQLAYKMLGDIKQVLLIPSIDYASFANLMARSYLVLTDSGGIQEEAPALGKPVIVLRNETERPEGVEAGTVIIAGVDESSVYNITHELLNDKIKYDKMAQAINPYGDGQASQRIYLHLNDYFAP